MHIIDQQSALAANNFINCYFKSTAFFVICAVCVVQRCVTVFEVRFSDHRAYLFVRIIFIRLLFMAVAAAADRCQRRTGTKKKKANSSVHCMQSRHRQYNPLYIRRLQCILWLTGPMQSGLFSLFFFFLANCTQLQRIKYQPKPFIYEFSILMEKPKRTRFNTIIGNCFGIKIDCSTCMNNVNFTLFQNAGNLFQLKSECSISVFARQIKEAKFLFLIVDFYLCLYSDMICLLYAERLKTAGKIKIMGF